MLIVCIGGPLAGECPVVHASIYKQARSTEHEEASKGRQTDGLSEGLGITWLSQLRLTY
jgi:hypothetical protein